jgi:hypothetical protein
MSATGFAAVTGVVKPNGALKPNGVLTAPRRHPHSAAP